MAISPEQYEQQFRQVQLRVNELEGIINDLSSQQGGATLPSLFQPVTPGVTPQMANQLRDGDIGFSVWGWNETSPIATNADEDEEAAWFYSNDEPVTGQALSLINNFTNPATPNQTLKSPDHSDYDPDYCDWDPTNGHARLNGIKTLDAPFPSNITGPGKTEFIVFIAARASKYVSLPRPFRIYCGVWDNTAGQRDWIMAANLFTIQGGVTQLPASITERRYKVLARTDRGYSTLSTELIVVDAPADGAFVPDQVYDSITWTPLPNNAGILSYDVYRYDVVANQYWLLKQVSSGARSYADQNTIERQVAGYPTATYDRGIAYVATTSGNLSNLAINGVSLAWSTLAVPVELAPDYNQGNTGTDATNQILRIGQNQPADWLLPDIETDTGSKDIQSLDGEFSLDQEGLSGLLTYQDGTTQDVTLVTFISVTVFTLDVFPLQSTKGVTLLITGGGFHGVLVDLVHASWQSGSTYGPNGDDLNRVLQPRAAPNGSSQGGTGTGGSGGESGGDGGIRCVAEGTPVVALVGDTTITVPVETLRKHNAVRSPNLTGNIVFSNEAYPCKEIWELETANGCYIRCSPTHPLITTYSDTRGIAASALQVGDYVLTMLDDKIERVKLTRCRSTGNPGTVYQLSLTPQHLYFAGVVPCDKTGGFLQSNVKPIQAQNQSEA